MTAIAERLKVKKFDAADDSRDFGPMKLDMLHFEDKTYTRVTLQPGARCTSLIPPEKLVDGLCNEPHFGYAQSGEMRIEMKDGEKFDVKAGAIFDIPAGHDALVLGNEPFTAIDLTGKAPEL